MMQSAGILLFRRKENILELLLIHPGGPYWKNKDAGSWSIPKGECNDSELPLNTAIREFGEETGINLQGDFIMLQPVRQKAGKWVHAWALEKDIDPDTIKSNQFEMEWPPKSGILKSFPEVDKAAWFTTDQAQAKIIPSQWAIIEELVSMQSHENSNI